MFTWSFSRLKASLAIVVGVLVVVVLGDSFFWSP